MTSLPPVQVDTVVALEPGVRAPTPRRPPQPSSCRKTPSRAPRRSVLLGLRLSKRCSPSRGRHCRDPQPGRDNAPAAPLRRRSHRQIPSKSCSPRTPCRESEVPHPALADEAAPSVLRRNVVCESAEEQVPPFWDSPTTEVDLTKWRLAKIGLTALVTCTK